MIMCGRISKLPTDWDNKSGGQGGEHNEVLVKLLVRDKNTQEKDGKSINPSCAGTIVIVMHLIILCFILTEVWQNGGPDI